MAPMALMASLSSCEIVPRAHVSFGQRRDTCLGADQKTRGLWERDCEIKCARELLFGGEIENEREWGSEAATKLARNQVKFNSWS